MSLPISNYFKSELKNLSNDGVGLRAKLGGFQRNRWNARLICGNMSELLHLCIENVLENFLLTLGLQM